MMKAYIVTIYPNKGGLRYIDSVWVVEESAIDRVDQIKAEFARSGYVISISDWWVWQREITIQDAELAQRPVPAVRKKEA